MWLFRSALCVVDPSLHERLPPSPAPVTSPTPVVIDHTAFPHLIDSILNFAEVPALMAFRATNHEYWARITPLLMEHVSIVQKSKEKDTHKGKAPKARTVAVSRTLPDNTLFRADKVPKSEDKARFWSFPSRPVKESKGMALMDAAYTQAPTTTSVVVKARAMFKKHRSASSTSNPIQSLLAHICVLDLAVRHLKPSTLKSLVRASPRLLILRLFDFPAAGIPATIPAADVVVLFMQDILPCPMRAGWPPNQVYSRMENGTRRLVVNICGQHMLSYANISTLYSLPSSVSELVFHLIDAGGIDVPCAGPQCDLGYLYIAGVIAHALHSEAGRCVVVTLPDMSSDEQEQGHGHGQLPPSSATVPPNMNAHSNSNSNSNSNSISNFHTTPIHTPALRPYVSLGDTREVLLSAVKDCLGQLPEAHEVDEHLARLHIMSRDEYICTVGLEDMLWETQP